MAQSHLGCQCCHRLLFLQWWLRSLLCPRLVSPFGILWHRAMNPQAALNHPPHLSLNLYSGFKPQVGARDPPLAFVLTSLIVLVCSGCRQTNIPETGWLKKPFDFSQCWRLASPGSRHQQIWLLVVPSFLIYRWPSPPCVLTWQRESSSLFIPLQGH